MKHELTEELIKDLYNKTNSQTQKRILDEVPELLGKRFKKGIWYTNQAGVVVYSTRDNDSLYGYGISGTLWCDDNGHIWSISSCAVEAIKEEVQDALIAEAKRRGFKDGAKFECLMFTDICNLNGMPRLFSGMWKFGKADLCDDDGNTIFIRGKWATIIEEIEEITIEQLEKERGHKIKIINND